jgi:hypothetical protein
MRPIRYLPARDGPPNRGDLADVSPDEFRREHNQDDCGYDQQSQLHPKVAERAATACLATLHVHLCGPPCDTAAQTAGLPKGKASFHPFDFVCQITAPPVSSNDPILSDGLAPRLWLWRLAGVQRSHDADPRE